MALSNLEDLPHFRSQPFYPWAKLITFWVHTKYTIKCLTKLITLVLCLGCYLFMHMICNNVYCMYTVIIICFLKYQQNKKTWSTYRSLHPSQTLIWRKKNVAMLLELHVQVFFTKFSSIWCYVLCLPGAPNLLSAKTTA